MTLNYVARFELPFSSPRPVLAVGAELKNTLCDWQGRIAGITESVGALSDADAYRRFQQQAEDLRELLGPGIVVAHDLHPAALATEYVRGWGSERIAVQHHHAHVASCMAEHGFFEPVIGICCDGTGYGRDGAVWGGEVLRVETTGFERSAHFAYFRLPGGDAAAKETWRPALSLVDQAFEGRPPTQVRSLFRDIDEVLLRMVEAMLRADFNCPRASSLGRLFDAVAFLAGYGARNDTEGQAAMRLEQAATGSGLEGRIEAYPFEMKAAADGPLKIDLAEMIRRICDELGRGESTELVAARFHETIATALSEAAARAAKRGGIDTVVLSGGCFFNGILKRRVGELLERRGIRRVLLPARVSPGDAGISLGQAVVAGETLRRRGSRCV